MSGSDRKSRGRNREEALFPVPSGKNVLPADYATMLDALKDRIRTERLRVTLAANAAMVQLYWDIGRAILERQRQQGWGAKVIDRLSHDLTTAFPDMTGLSPRNLKYMRAFAEAWPDREFVQQLAAQIPWTHRPAAVQKQKTAHHGIRPTRIQHAHGRCRMGNSAHRNPARGTQGQLAEHRGDRSRTGRGGGRMKYEMGSVTCESSGEYGSSNLEPFYLHFFSAATIKKNYEDLRV